MMMKPIRSLILPVVVAGIMVGLIFAYVERREERDQEATAETPVVAPSRVEEGSNGSRVLRLDVATQARLGLQTALPVAGSAVCEITANARVLNAASLIRQLDAIHAAEATLVAARRPYHRTRQLFENGLNASVAAVEAAEARVTQSQLTLDAARHRLTAEWGANLAHHDNLPELARSLLARNQALVRVELLATATLAAEPPAVRLFRLDGSELSPARVLGAAPRTDSTVAGRALLALVETNASTLVPGTLLTARIATGQRDRGVVLPRDAVLRQAGRGWVYVKTGEDTFTRREVLLNRPHPDGWLVSGEWPEPVVVAGAESLLSEELKGSIQMKD